MYPCYIWALSTRCPQRPPPALAGGALPVRRPKSVVGQAWRLSRTRRPGDADRRGYALPVPPPPAGFGSPIRSTPCHCIFSKLRNLMFASLIFWSLVSFGASFQKRRNIPAWRLLCAAHDEGQYSGSRFGNLRNGCLMVQ